MKQENYDEASMVTVYYKVIKTGIAFKKTTYCKDLEAYKSEIDSLFRDKSIHLDQISIDLC